MYYILKIFSYCPIFNISGEDKSFGDLEKSSRAIRISLIGFTLIYFFTFLSIFFDKKTKRLRFEFFHILKYPLLSIPENEVKEKIAIFTKNIESSDEEALISRLSVIKDKIEGQKENINHSLVKANVVLAIFIGVFLFFMESKLSTILSFNGPIAVKILLWLLTFSYFTSCINLYYFITRLTKVTSYCEVSIPKSNNKHSALKETLIEYYTKFTRNKCQSTNQVSYNIWVQDYFKKFIIYGSLIFIILSFPYNLFLSAKSHLSQQEIYSSFQLSYKDSALCTFNISELNKSRILLDSLKLTKIVMFFQESKINRLRIACLERYYDHTSKIRFSKEITPVEKESVDKNKIFVIILGYK